MREWPGLELNKQPVGNGVTTIDNTDIASRGELNRRKGLGNYFQTTPTFNRMRQYHTGPLRTINASGSATTTTNYTASGGVVTLNYNPQSGNDTFEILNGSGGVVATSGSVGTSGTLTANLFGAFSIRVTASTAWSYALTYYESKGVLAVQTGINAPLSPKVSIVGAGSNLAFNFADLANAVRGGTIVTTASAAYWHDGVNPVRAFYQQTSIDAGITAPGSAPTTGTAAGGSVTAGTHLIRYRYYDSTRRRYSDPSPAVSVNILGQVTATAYSSLTSGAVGTVSPILKGEGYTANQALSFAGGAGSGAAGTWFLSGDSRGSLGAIQLTNSGSAYTSPPTVTVSAPPTSNKTITVTVVALGNSTVDKIIIEMTLANGSEFYQAASVSNTGATINITMNDDTLAVQVAAADYTEDGYGHAIPPKGTISIVHGNRMFIWGATSESADTLYWSRLGFVESFKPAEWSRRVFGSTPDTPRSMFSLSDDLYLIGSRSMYRLAFTGDPGTGFLIPLPTTCGAWNHQCVIEGDGAYFGFGPSGVWAVKALQPQEISQRPREYFSEQLDTTRTAEIFGWWDPVVRSVNFTFPDKTGVFRTMSYWLDDDKWITHSYKQKVSAACAVEWDDGIVEPMIAGQACVYRFTYVKQDGGGTQASGTVSTYAGSTLTVNAAHEQFVNTWCYFPRTDQYGEVTGVPSTTQLTIAGLTGLVNGDEVQYGPIPFQVVSEWIPFQNLERGRNGYLRIEAAKSETLAVLQVRLYTDWSNIPFAYSTDSLTTAPNGVTYDPSKSRFLIDMNQCNGMVKIPLPSDFTRVVRYDIRVLTSSNGVHLMDAEFEQPRSREKGAE